MHESEEMDFGDRYERVRELGSGSFGTAHLMRDRATGELVAVKYMDRGDWIDHYVEREILNHIKLSGHPNIVAFKEAFLTSTHLGIAMEFADGGELFAQIAKRGQLSEEEARYIFQQLVFGLVWCHSKGVSHRDIKLENTLLHGAVWGSQLVKICDWGYSNINSSKPKTRVGTPHYTAPELFEGAKYEGEPADVWSCGVALYTMLVGAYPFQDPEQPNNTHRLMQRILASQYSFPGYLHLSRYCKDLIQQIFVADPAKRITLAGIQAHPWFQIHLSRQQLPPAQQQQLHQFARPAQSEEDIRALVAQARSCTRRGAVLDQPPSMKWSEYGDEGMPDVDELLDEV